MRMNQKAALVPEAQFQSWYDQAMRTPGLSSLDRDLLGVICAYYRRLHAEGFAGGLSTERMAHRIGAEPRDIRIAVKHLLELGLLAVQPGGGQRPNEYRPCLPRRLIAAMTTPAAEDDAPPF
jgi:hypothetical protein